MGVGTAQDTGPGAQQKMRYCQASFTLRRSTVGHPAFIIIYEMLNFYAVSMAIAAERWIVSSVVIAEGTSRSRRRAGFEAARKTACVCLRRLLCLIKGERGT